MARQLIIGLCATTGKGSGKSTAAKILQEFYLEQGLVAEIKSFAEPIKRMIQYGLGISDRYTKHDKEAHTYLGQTARKLMQTLGTEWGRDMVHKDIWVKVMAKYVRNRHLVDVVIIDDVRYNNEARWIRKQKGTIIDIYRPKIDNKDKHRSEMGLKDKYIDSVVINDDNIQKLTKILKQLL